MTWCVPSQCDARQCRSSMQEALLLLVLGSVIECDALNAFRHLDTLPVGFNNYKVWRRDSLFSNKDHWKGGRAPCGGDRVVFPRDLGGVSAYMGAGILSGGRFLESSPSVQIREMVLPWNGDLVMPEGTSITIGGEEVRNKDCPGTDRLWGAVSLPFWLDPSNWWDPSVLDADSEAVPHLMRIPCGQDVAFIGHPAFHIMMPEITVQVGGIFLDQERGLLLADQSEALDQLEDRLFSPRPWLRLGDVLHLSATTPSELRGHQCGRAWQDPSEQARQELEQAVCKHVTCPVPACSKPVRPHLHCCYVCGAVLEVTGASNPAAVKTLVLAEDLAFGVSQAVHVGVVPAQPEIVQVVVIGEEFGAFAELLQNTLNTAGLGPLCRVQLRLAGPRVSPASAASVLATLLGSLCLVILGLALLLYLKQRPQLPPLRAWNETPASFLFARFENAPEDARDGAEAGVGPAVEVGLPGAVTSARGSWSARSFRNPLFQDAEQHSEEETSPQTPRKALQENVSFSELQARRNSKDQNNANLEDETAIVSDDSKNLVDIAL